MAKAVAIFTGGITELRQAAVREDGVVFVRSQERTRYGLNWSAWRPTGEVMGDNMRQGVSEYEFGFATLRKASPNDCFINNRALFNDKGEIRVRLP